MDEDESNAWFSAVHIAQYERPATPGDPDWWDWQVFAAEWARDLLRNGRD